MQANKKNTNDSREIHLNDEQIMFTDESIGINQVRQNIVFMSNSQSFEELNQVINNRVSTEIKSQVNKDSKTGNEGFAPHPTVDKQSILSKQITI